MLILPQTANVIKGVIVDAIECFKAIPHNYCRVIALNLASELLQIFRQIAENDAGILS